MSQQLYKYATTHGVYNVWIEKHKYANGRVALILMDNEGQVTIATVNLPEHDLQPGEVIIKSYSENEGMLDFLTNNNIVSATGREIQTGFVTVHVCKLLI